MSQENKQSPAAIEPLEYENVRDDILALLMEFEGCRLTAYKCSAGVNTIGWGHTAGVKEGDSISQEEADRMLAEDARAYYEDMLRLVAVPLTGGMAAALTSFCYNLGASYCKTCSLFKELNKGNYAVAAGKFGDYVYAGKMKLAGLVKRRAKEKEIFERDGFPCSNATGLGG